MTTKFSINPLLPLRNAGFSLVELSITLVIIAFIVGAATSGMIIKHNLELQDIMGDISTLTQATNEFNAMYGGLPGDLWNATEKFGVSNTVNGNGNGLIDTPDEQLLAFQHLSLAGLIKGDYPSTWAIESLMRGSIPNSTFYFDILEDATAITFTAIGSEQASRIAILSPDDMYSLDKKYDDAMPNTGTIRAFTGDEAVACTEGDDATSGYNMTNENPACYFTISIRSAFQ